MCLSHMGPRWYKKGVTGESNTTRLSPDKPTLFIEGNSLAQAEELTRD